MHVFKKIHSPIILNFMAQTAGPKFQIAGIVKNTIYYKLYLYKQRTRCVTFKKRTMAVRF